MNDLSIPETENNNTSIVQIISGQEVLDKITESDFLSDWDLLYNDCPWATAFQHSSFARSWYQLYHEQYEPVLAYEYDSDGLVGLLALALDGAGKIIGAGEAQAEYQVWLARDASPDFIFSAIDRLQEQFPHTEIHLKFLPPGTPVHDIKEKLGQEAFLKEVDQPILTVDFDELTKELQKKNKKEKIRRLKRLGNLTFEKVENPGEFERIFDELAIQSDFRKGAMFDALFFHEDSKRKEFLLNLFGNNLLHVTVLKVDDEIIASNVGVTGRGWVHLQGINTHSPMHAKHSPGILHFLMLGQKLSEEGLHSFDLTPGADGYKHALATEVQTAYQLTVFASRLSKKKAEAIHSVHQYLKEKLMKVGVSNYDLRDFRKQRAIWKQKLGLALKNRLLPFDSLRKERLRLLVYIGPSEGTVANSDIKINDLESLLEYSSGKSLMTRWEFLDDAMKRLEAGQTCLTMMKEGELIACSWIRLSELKKTISPNSPQLPKESLVLENFYFSDNELENQLVTQLVEKAVEQFPQRKIYLLINEKRRLNPSLFSPARI
jgi:hypothetical protein